VCEFLKTSWKIELLAFQKIFSLTPRLFSLDETGSERALALQTAPQPQSNGIKSKSKASSAFTW
jgi:hypothetical protein